MSHSTHSTLGETVMIVYNSVLIFSEFRSWRHGQHQTYVNLRRQHMLVTSRLVNIRLIMPQTVIHKHIDNWHQHINNEREYIYINKPLNQMSVLWRVTIKSIKTANNKNSRRLHIWHRTVVISIAYRYRCLRHVVMPYRYSLKVFSSYIYRAVSYHISCGYRYR